MTQTPQKLQAQRNSLENAMGFTTTGLSTRDIDDPGRKAPNLGRITSEDRKFFVGSAVEVHPAMTDKEILTQIRADFIVDKQKYYNAKYGVTCPKLITWHRADRGPVVSPYHGSVLGRFSHKRHPLDPPDAMQFFRDFCEHSGKEISLDVVCYDHIAQRFICASKLTANKNVEHVGDITDSWMIISVDYAKPRSIVTYVWHQELACLNGMTRRVTPRDKSYLSQRKIRTYDDVFPYLDGCLKECAVYNDLKNRMIERKLRGFEAKNFIRGFFRDTESMMDLTAPPESRAARQVEDLYFGNIKGGHLDSRQDNAWKLWSAITEWTTHHRKAASPEARFSHKIEGPLAQIDRRSMNEIESMLLSPV